MPAQGNISGFDFSHYREVFADERNQESYRKLASARAARPDHDPAQWRSTLRQRYLDCQRTDDPNMAPLNPYEWQLDVAEAMYLGMDVVLIAGTGEGKTIPFHLLSLIDEHKKCLQISPLTMLSQDQVGQYEHLGLRALNITSNSWKDSQVRKAVKDGAFNAILTGPEMAFEKNAFNALLRDPEYHQKFGFAIFDEAHTISKWRDTFRTKFGLLGNLRAYLSKGTPFLATSATIPTSALNCIQDTLMIHSADCFSINLGNDRPNIYHSVVPVVKPADLKNILLFLPELHSALSPSEILKTIIYVDDKKLAQLLCHELKALYPNFKASFDYVYSTQSAGDKKKIIRRFKLPSEDPASIRVLFGTECAGMGMDISNIERGIQVGVPRTLSVLKQHMGRVARSKNINGIAILLAQDTHCRPQKKTAPRKPKSELEVKIELIDGPDDLNLNVLQRTAPAQDTRPENNNPSIDIQALEGDKYTAPKTVELSMLQYIRTEDCEQEFCDNFFKNPQGRTPPTDRCCHHCERKSGRTSVLGMATSLQPPFNATAGSGSLSYTSNNTNSNGKQLIDLTNDSDNNEPIVLQADDPTRSTVKARSGKLRIKVTEALHLWRDKKYKESNTLWPSAIILPDKLLNKISSDGTIHSSADIRKLKHTENWAAQDEYIDSVIECIHQINEAHREQMTGNKRKKTQNKYKIAAQKRQADQAVNIQECKQGYWERWAQSVEDTPEIPTPTPMVAGPSSHTTPRTSALGSSFKSKVYLLADGSHISNPPCFTSSWSITPSASASSPQLPMYTYQPTPAPSYISPPPHYSVPLPAASQLQFEFVDTSNYKYL